MLLRGRKSPPTALARRGDRVPQICLKDLGVKGRRGGGFAAACGGFAAAGGGFAARAAFDVLTDFQVFDCDTGLLVFHVGFLVWLLWLAPNNNRAPPVTAFRGIKSSNRMHVAFLPDGLAAEVLPKLLGFWGTVLLVNKNGAKASGLPRTMHRVNYFLKPGSHNLFQGISFQGFPF